MIQVQVPLELLTGMNQCVPNNARALLTLVFWTQTPECLIALLGWDHGLNEKCPGRLWSLSTLSIVGGIVLESSGIFRRWSLDRGS